MLNDLATRYDRSQKVMKGYPILVTPDEVTLKDINFYQKELDEITADVVRISFPILRAIIHDKIEIMNRNTDRSNKPALLKVEKLSDLTIEMIELLRRMLYKYGDTIKSAGERAGFDITGLSEYEYIDLLFRIFKRPDRNVHVLQITEDGKTEYIIEIPNSEQYWVKSFDTIKEVKDFCWKHNLIHTKINP
jgi:hypothetical protein